MLANVKDTNNLKEAENRNDYLQSTINEKCNN